MMNRWKEKAVSSIEMTHDFVSKRWKGLNGESSLIEFHYGNGWVHLPVPFGHSSLPSTSIDRNEMREWCGRERMRGEMLSSSPSRWRVFRKMNEWKCWMASSWGHDQEHTLNSWKKLVNDKDEMKGRTGNDKEIAWWDSGHMSIHFLFICISFSLSFTVSFLFVSSWIYHMVEDLRS